MQVTIYHNLSRDASFGYNTVFAADTSVERGYVKRPAQFESERHPLVKVFEYTTDTYDAQDLLNEAFETFNIGTNGLAQAYRARRLRSLSAGDVVQVDNRAWACGSVGWDEVDLSEAKVLQSAEAEHEVRERYDFAPWEELAVTVPLV